MKPLDLQVGIQNSYEAARSEAVRLEKPHVAGMLANEDAQRDQVLRDQSVNAPESRDFQDDLFSAEEYHNPDYADSTGSGKRKGTQRKKTPSAPVSAANEEQKTDTEKPETTGFSTYA